MLSALSALSRWMVSMKKNVGTVVTESTDDSDCMHTD